MKKSELIKRLEEIDGDPEVMILDGFNGGGAKRDLNLGPILDRVTKSDHSETSDCKGRIGEKVIVIGYGCY